MSLHSSTEDGQTGRRLGDRGLLSQRAGGPWVETRRGHLSKQQGRARVNHTEPPDSQRPQEPYRIWNLGVV